MRKKMYDSPQTLFLIPISILQWGKPLIFQTLFLNLISILQWGKPLIFQTLFLDLVEFIA